MITIPMATARIPSRQGNLFELDGWLLISVMVDLPERTCPIYFPGAAGFRD
jgi:hypothetical protein